MSTPTTTIRIGEKDRELLDQIKRELYIDSTGGAMRAALRIAAQVLKERKAAQSGSHTA